LRILSKYHLENRIPDSIVEYLIKGTNGIVPETPKYDDDIFRKVQNVIIGNNSQAGKAALEQAKQEGLNTHLFSTTLEGEASIAGQLMANILKEIIQAGKPISRPACIVSGGETTVTITPGHDATKKGYTGTGGRNQELALASVENLAGCQDIMLIALATDGEDGPTDAAGAVVTGRTFFRAKSLGMNPKDFLSHHSSYKFFNALNDSIKIGSTQTNVNDLVFLFAF
jgi:hydroxypyruvate reductase